MAERKLSLKDVEAAKTVSEKLAIGEKLKAQLEADQADLEKQLEGIRQNLAALGTAMYSASRDMLAGMGITIRQGEASTESKAKGGRKAKPKTDLPEATEADREKVLAAIPTGKANALPSGRISKAARVNVGAEYLKPLEGVHATGAGKGTKYYR